MISKLNQLVLYVEDEENDALFLKLGFKRAGASCSIHVVTDGRQAMDYMLGSGRFADRALYPIPSLMLLDLNLPKFNGFEVLERLRQEPQFYDLPIIIFSSSEQASDQEKARCLNATDYFIKPQSISGFTEVAHQLEERWLVNMPASLHAHTELTPTREYHRTEAF